MEGLTRLPNFFFTCSFSYIRIIIIVTIFMSIITTIIITITVAIDATIYFFNLGVFGKFIVYNLFPVF